MDFQRIVEYLRDLRQGPLQSVNDDITNAATQYAALCTHANERLRQCSTFLQQGLRSEALHMADENPNLLDLVAALDLPDAQAWAEFCQNNGLPVPPPLQLDRAAQLNDAYAADQPVEHLLAQHRLLALSRAPVRQRLDVMRRLLAADAGNANWEKDIRIFERARMKEIPAAFQSAVKRKDNDGIVALADEVNNQTWYEPMPADLSQGISEAYARVRRSQVEAQLEKLVEPLRDAFAARSLQECQAFVQRWKKIMADASVTHISSELTDEIKPVIQFVTEQTKRDEYLKKFRESCKAFGALLDQEADDGTLEAGYARLKEFKEEIPEELTERYQAKRAGRRKAADRSHKVRLVTIAAFAAGIIIIGLVTIFLFMRSGKARESANAIKAYLLDHSPNGINGAQSYVNDLKQKNPSLLDEPLVREQVSALEAAKSELAGDTQSLASLVKEAGQAVAGAAPIIGNADASMADVTRAAGLLESANNKIDANSARLQWVDEKGELSSAQKDVAGSLEKLQSRVRGGAATELQQLDTDLAQVPENSNNPEVVKQMRDQLAALHERTTALSRTPLLPQDQKTAVEAMLKKITDREAAAGANMTMADELQALRTHTDSADDVQSGLNDFVRRFPNDSHKADFTAALARIPLAVSFDEWNKLVASIGTDLSAAGAAETQKRADAIAAYLTANPNTPMAAQANAYQDYLKHAIDAQADKGAWDTALADIAGNPLLTDLEQMKSLDGKIYYTLGDAEVQKHTLNGVTSISFKAVDPANLTDKSKWPVIRLDNAITEKPEAAPHTKVINELIAATKTIRAGDWDTFGIDQTDKVMRSDMDVVIKALLVQTLLKTEEAVNTSGSAAPLGGIYTQTLADLDKIKPATLTWIKPETVNAATRKSLEAVLAKIPSANAAREQVKASREALFKSLTLNTLGTGILLKDDAGKWTIYTRVSPQPGSSVITFLPAADGNGPAKIQPIASYTTKFIFDDNALAGVTEGTLIYILKP